MDITKETQIGKSDTSKKQQKQAGMTKMARKMPRPGVTDYLAGEAKDVRTNLKPYLPQDLIGGSIPHIPGTEDEGVWNAASQACGTEKLNYVYAIDNGRVWYLACPSASLASDPDSWCPIAAALPGNSEFWDKETVYLYEEEGLASALRWDPETGRMQVFLGASRTILPRVQSMDANFVTINPDIANVYRWRSRSLRTEKMSRVLTRMLIFSGMGVTLIAALILLANLLMIGIVKTDLKQVKEQTDQAALDLVKNASNVMQSDTIRHMVRVQGLLSALSLSNGYLVKYEVTGRNVDWEAIVPQALAESAIVSTTYHDTSDGRIRSYKPKSTKEDSDHVRLIGKK